MDVFRSLPRRFVLTACLLATAALLPFFSLISDSRSDYALVVEMAADRMTAAQLFFDIGRGFNESDSVAVTLPCGTEPQVQRFPFPGGGLRKLRFDPVNTGGSATVRNARIENRDGRIVRKLAPDDFEPVHDVTDLRPAEGGGFSFSVTQGRADPIFEIKTGILASVSMSTAARVLRYVVRWGLICGFLLLAGVLMDRVLARRGGGLAALIERRPIAFLAIVSAASVAIQCHPVLFFGKSFVSPDVGCYMLYDGFPTLPGYKTESIEDIKGSDNAAILLSHIHMPKITGQAVFRDGELPLWNRYNTCGVPALGQGQFMFGELLSIPAVLWQSEAWTWDFRFLAARWLYAFGVGLAVWLLTRHVLSSGIIAATAAYIGFFAFRLNHPAQFSLCAAPWILVAWLVLRQASGPRQLAWAGLALIVANWQVHVSGTVKEAIVLMLCVNFAGFVILALDRSSWRVRGVRLGVAVFVGVVYVLVTAPVWMTFVQTLALTHTNYSAPIASQIPPWAYLGFFEDLAYRGHRVGEPHVLPSANLVVLVGLAWALICVRDLVEDRGLLALGLAALVPWATAFSVVPAEWLKAMPFIANIHHIDNSFSCALIVLSTVLAGGGIRLLCRAVSRPDWPAQCVQFAVFVGILVALLYGTVQYAPYSPFLKSYAPSLALGLVAVHVALAGWRRERRAGLVAVSLAACCVVLLWRHGTYNKTPFDPYVVNPKVRASFHAHSAGVEFVNEHMTEPSRPNGIRYNVFSGYSQMLGWESIYGVEALRSPWSEEFYRAAPIRKFFWGIGIPDWSQWLEEDARILQPFLDALNVRFYLATPGTPTERMRGLRFLSSSDFDIYESPSVWPRAFFTDRVVSYDSVAALVDRIKQSPDGRPFAAVAATERSSLELAAGVINDAKLVGRTIEAARDYRLTTNTTTFRVTANGPGVVVLAENFFPRDFRAYVNGKRTPYFRVNHMFKAVAVTEAGDYEIRFEYWPHGMTRSLTMAAVGVALGLGAFGLAWWAGRRRDTLQVAANVS